MFDAKKEHPMSVADYIEPVKEAEEMIEFITQHYENEAYASSVERYEKELDIIYTKIFVVEMLDSMGKYANRKAREQTNG